MASSSATPDVHWKRMGALIDQFYKNKDAEPFRDPVPWEAYGLVDYPTIIKTPMDLGTIRKKIKEKKYSTIYQCAEDVRLVWRNCMQYNADGSDFYVLAKKLETAWESDYNKLCNDIGAANTSSAAATGGGDDAAAAAVPLQTKRAMAKLLYQITKEDLGKILVEIEQKCPSAIKRNATEEELELNIDAIPANVMGELTAMLQKMKGSGKKKPPANKAKKQKTAPAAAAASVPSAAAAAAPAAAAAAAPAKAP